MRGFLILISTRHSTVKEVAITGLDDRSVFVDEFHATTKSDFIRWDLFLKQGFGGAKVLALIKCETLEFEKMNDHGIVW